MLFRFALILCLLFISHFAQASDTTHKVLVVGSEQNFPPFAIGDSDEAADGFTVDLWKVVAKEAGLKYKIRVRPWAQILQEFKDGQVDVLINVAQSDDRKKYTDFSVPHVTVNGAIFVRKNDTRIRTEADLKGKSVIVFKADLAHEYAASSGLQVQLVVVDTAKDGLNLLASGKHDAMLLSKLAGKQTLHQLGIKNVQALDAKVGYAQKFSFGVHTGDAELLARLNEGLALAKASGAYDAIYQKWFGIYETKEPTLWDVLKYVWPFAGLIALLAMYLFYRRGVERKQAANALLESKLRLDTILANVGACIFIKDTQYKYIYVNRMVCDLFGLEEQDILGKDDTAFFSADSVEEIMRSDRPVIERGETVRREETDLAVDPDARRTYLTVKLPLRDSSGKIYALCGISTDITERKTDEEKLRRSNSLNQSIIDSSTDSILLLDLHGRLQFMSPQGLRERGIDNGDGYLDAPYEDFWQGESRDAALQAISKARQGEQGRFEANSPVLDGSVKWWEVIVTPVGSPDGKPEQLLVVSRDITERRMLEDNLRRQTVQLENELAERQVAQEALQEQTVILEEEIEERNRVEEALQRSESTIRNKLAAILEPEGDIGKLELSDIIDCEKLRSLLKDFYQVTGILGAVLDVSGNVLVAVGWQDICTKFHRCHPDSLKNCLESDTILTTGVPAGTFRQYRCKNNMWDMVTPLEIGGRHVGNVFIGQFFYEDEVLDLDLFRKQAERYGFDEAEYLAALDRVPRLSREKAQAGMQFYAELTKIISSLSFSSIKVSRMLAERIKLEEQLRQSQKMEAIGLLAGGVAHDFNNILTVIMGYCSLLELDPHTGPKVREATDAIMSSTEKAAQLTKGLLAFSRKQVLSVKTENLNDIVHRIEKFVARIIGEDIQFKSIYHGRELPVRVDAGQIEQVLINMATNARDAMSKGGSLTLETSSLKITDPFEHAHGYAPQGEYACISVSDTGCGMNEETRSKIFEPFFTTKEVGKGTGLGMAIAYGIIQQHNGFVNVYSEEEIGTTFRIYLPLVAPSPSEQVEENMQTDPGGGTETILLAEDDAKVRRLTVTILSKFGYDVIEAEDGLDAVEKFTTNQDKIRLILMDMIMPRMNGRDAYEEINKRRPGVRVLYTSGYTADFIQNRGVSEEGIDLIMKPVQPMKLLRTVREILDR